MPPNQTQPHQPAPLQPPTPGSDVQPSTPPDLTPQSSGPTPSPMNHPELTPPRNDKKSLVIALIVAVLLLVAAAGAWTWFTWQNESGNTVGNTVNNQTQDSTDTQNIKKVSFIAPSNLPETYVKREQNIEGASSTFYADSATACGITTGVMDLNDQNGKTAKDAIVKSANAAQSIGVKTTKSEDGPEFTFKDADNPQEYAFPSIQLEQEVNVEGVDFKKQYNIIAFKQFGNQAASVGISCKDATWESKKAELEGYMKAFTVKAER